MVEERIASMMKNYTSGVPVETTIARIEKTLAQFNATAIAKSYKNGEVESLQFGIIEPLSGKAVTIHLPAKASAIETILKAKVRRPQAGTMKKIKAQAARTAWKIIQDWVEIQLSLVEMGQAETLQVFLPYVWDGNKTVFDMIKGTGFKLLEAQSGAKWLIASGGPRKIEDPERRSG